MYIYVYLLILLITQYKNYNIQKIFKNIPMEKTCNIKYISWEL